MNIKRMNYFKGEFLNEDDFKDEQKYHIETLRRHNKNLHTWGIANGLDVPVVTGGTTVTVKSGMAIDSSGRQIMLEEEVKKDIPSTSGKILYLTISYKDELSDPREDNPGIEQSTRITDVPEILFKEKSDLTDPSMRIILAKITLDDTGKISDIDLSERKRAGSVVGDLAANSITLSIDNVDASRWPKIKGADGTTPGIEIASQKTIMKGNLEITGDVRGNLGPNMVDTNQIVNNAVTVDKIVNGAVTIDKLSAPVKATINSSLLSMNNVSNPGGNIDLISPDNSIIIKPDTINKNIALSTTYDRVKALSISGGSLSGSLNIRQTADNQSLYVQNNKPGVCTGILSAISAVVVDPIKVTYNNAAVAGSSNVKSVNGVYAYAPPGTDALFVQGTATVTGGVTTGHIVETFVNASGYTLRTGDVVKLKGSPVARFRGENNKVPVAEVALVDKENDNLIIGIVDRKATPSPDAVDIEEGPYDPTTIEDGKELAVVILGAYAHCKVDASEAAIEVGDLLTSSSNKGHAKKATDPKIGCIIGKALEPLKEGTGYIAVFVNMK